MKKVLLLVFMILLVGSVTVFAEKASSEPSVIFYGFDDSSSNKALDIDYEKSNDVPYLLSIGLTENDIHVLKRSDTEYAVIRILNEVSHVTNYSTETPMKSLPPITVPETYVPTTRGVNIPTSYAPSYPYTGDWNGVSGGTTVYTNYKFPDGYEFSPYSYYGCVVDVYAEWNGEIIYSFQINNEYRPTVAPEYYYYASFSPYKKSWSTEYTVSKP
jgi:hypothetical protein